MWPNLQFPADFDTFTEEILNGKLHFLCSDLVCAIETLIQFLPTTPMFWTLKEFICIRILKLFILEYSTLRN